jgi:hypothetical protein
MKIKLTTAQFKRLLATAETNSVRPIITLDLGKISKKEAQEIIDLLKEKKV